jgi:polyhydroxyalkanoate synthesis regulator phasin
MNADRICKGLSKIGYTPSSAICDIIDNAVQAKAMQIHVKITREKNVSEARINNVREYLVIDNGAGMKADQMINALALGSSADDYDSHSLSKFGLGLKSASFSQGEVLEVISSPGDGTPFLKYIVSLQMIHDMGQYGAENVDLSPQDIELIANHLPEKRGTIVRVGQVRKLNHPSIKSTLEELRMKVGAIYYYMMRDDGLQISIDGELCEPFDVLFIDEANQNGNLIESEWDGMKVCWIEKPYEVTADSDNNIKMTVEVTQLPHPPTFELNKIATQQQIRDKYLIGAGNYGFYIYRNHRLLGWAERFQGLPETIIPQDQDYYAFRGRIIIDDSADEIFNIDVKKSQIMLSNEARKTLADLASEYRRKSRKAWQRMSAEIRRRTNEEGLARANTIAAQFEEIDELPGMLDSEEAFAEAAQREQEILQEQTERIKELFTQETSVDTLVGDDKILEPTTEQAEKVVTGGQAMPNDKIFLVTSTEDNALWEPYYDPDKKTCVRINRLHRFARVIYEENRNNGAMIILFGLMLQQLAAAETFVQKHTTKYKRDDIESILQEYRRVCTEGLARLCREAGDSLPNDG